MVGVAQLVEPRIVIPVVVGSSPIVHPTFSIELNLGVLFERPESIVYVIPVGHSL